MLAFLWSIQGVLVDWFNAANQPIQTVIFFDTAATISTTSQAARSGQTPVIRNFGKEVTMHLLRIMEKHLPIGSKGWKSVVHDHERNFWATAGLPC